ncbi:MAG: hypothetical protein ABMA64_33415 [Myxococcota bacterium]
MILTALFATNEAHAYIDAACLELAQAGPPEGYDEQAQQDFLVNYFGLSTTFSPIHAPIPHEPGHGAIGLELSVIPPLGCQRRLVLSYTKTEDTNKSPLVPRPRLTFAFPAIGKFVPYAGLGYVPPLPVLGMSNVIVSGEVGVGVPLGEHAQLGGRFHATMMKTVGELAPPFAVDGTPFDDLYMASTFGFDLMFGVPVKSVTPYLALGFTDESTFFFIGDDGVVTNNYHPYFGPTGSLGVDGKYKRLRLGGEFYAAPGGYSLPDENAVSVKPASRYGKIYTGRFRVGVEI